MIDETKETQNTEQEAVQAVESTPAQEPVNPYLAGAQKTVQEEPIVQEQVQQENPWQAVSAASPIPEEPKKNPAVKVAIILAIVAVILIVAIVALAFSGLFGNKKATVAQAFQATLEESETYLKDVWQAEEYEGMFEEKESSIEMDFSLPEGISFEAIVDSTEEETDFYVDFGMGGSSLVEVEGYANETQAFFAMPDYFDYVFYLDLETMEEDIQVAVDNGIIDSYTADEMLETLEMQERAVEPSDEAVDKLGEDLKAAWTTLFEEAELEEIDSEELTVNDEEVECEGYAFVLTPELIANLGQATLDAYQDNEEVMDFIEYLELSNDTDVVTEMFEVLEEAVDELNDIDPEDKDDATLYINVYLYDGKVARIDSVDSDDEVWFAWNIEGGNFPLENTSIEFEIDGDWFELYRTGSMDDDEYKAEYEFVDEYGTSYVLDTRYTPETGDIELEFLEDDWSYIFVLGALEKTDDATIEFTVDSLEYEEEEILSGDIVITNECDSIEKPDGEEINILTMTEEEWTELFMDVYLELY